ncbi:MAG: multidrug transporter [Gammaproteobacteria bacterium]|nr:MAG: multidrug transporter [Gammaproteobacteria bacterium]
MFIPKRVSMSENQKSEMQHPQFYKQVVALSEKAHADWRINGEIHYDFANKTNAVLITAVEFILVSREYPIVFLQKDGQVSPVAILGLKPEQNLYINSDGKWEADYIPAYVRRFPFILAGDVSQKNPQYTVCIDENFQGFNRKTGERLFEKDGKHSAYLETAIQFLKDYQTQGLATERFCKILSKLDILEPMQANIASKQGEEFSVAGFMVINRDKLKALKAVQIVNLVKTDAMDLIYHHLSSLSNLKKLTDQYAAKSIAKAS